MGSERQISRRTLLRGVGVSVALPLLEGMRPRQLHAARQTGEVKPPVRMGYLFVPNGMHMPDWTPQEEGPLKTLPKTLQAVAKYKDKINVLSNLTLDGGRSHGDGPGDHARCVASFLTGAHPRKTNGKDIYNGRSIDQVAAERIGHLTRFPSLELGCEESARAGRCDSGYSCIYTSNMSWRTPTSAMGKEINPRAVFDRLFGTGDTESLANREKRNRTRKSILDFVKEDASSLNNKLGRKDKQKMDEYLYALRQIERRVEESEKLMHREIEVPDFPRPKGVPRKFDEHVRLMLDMIVLAWQTDSTRITTFMFTNAGSNRSYPEIDVPNGHHSLSHHGGDKNKQAKISKINYSHATHLAYFLGKLRAVQEGEGTLLDNSMIMYGSGLGDGNRHNHDGLPILLAGAGGGTIATGRHIRYEDETPLTNLFLSMLDRVDAKLDKFSDSTGRLARLENA